MRNLNRSDGMKPKVMSVIMRDLTSLFLSKYEQLLIDGSV